MQIQVKMCLEFELNSTSNWAVFIGSESKLNSFDAVFRIDSANELGYLLI